MTTTIDNKPTMARAFGLKGDSWMRHANPTSVWTRFAALPLLAVAIWSRDWFGWLSLLPIGVSFLDYGLWVLNPLAAVLGLLIVQGGKVWCIDRMVLLFDAMKARNAEY